MLKTDELLNEAISLPVELRAQLVDALLRSLNPAQAEMDELWAAEAERRIDQIDAGQAQLIPGEEVFAKLRQERHQQDCRTVGRSGGRRGRENRDQESYEDTGQYPSG